MILTKSNSDRFDIGATIDEYISGGRLDEILFIVPTNRKMRNFKKRIIDLAPEGIATEIYLETLTTISQKLLSEKRRFVELTEFTAMVLLREVVEEIDLHYFAVYSDGIPFGTLMKIKETLSEYKRLGISPELLKEEAEKLNGAEKKKATDIYMIYSNFLNKSVAMNALEVGDVYASILKFNKDDFRSAFGKLYGSVKVIVAFGFDEFTLPEARLLSMLSSEVEQNLFIDLDYYKYNPVLFSHLDKTYDRLLSMGFRQIEDISQPVDPGFGKTLRENLFKRKSRQYERFSENIKITGAFNRKNEVEIIAKEIKLLITEKGVEPNEICVAFNLINNYSDTVRYVFENAGVPFNITDRISLDKAKPVSAVINLLDVQENDYYYKNILRAALNGFLTIPECDVNSIMEVSRGLKIVAGKINWINRIKHALVNPFNDEVFNIPHNILESALKSVRSIENLLDGFKEPMTAADFVAEIKSLILRVKLVDNIITKSNHFAEANIKAVTVFLENIEEVFGLLSKEQNEKRELGYYLDILKTLAKASRFNTKEKSDYGVLVTNPEEIRGLKFKYLFLGGMIDKDFPTQYSPEVFVSGDFTKGEKIHLTEQRYRFYRALITWSEGLYFTYPRSEENTEYVESSFLKEFKRLFAVEESSAADFNSVIVSATDFQKHYFELDEKLVEETAKRFDFRERRLIDKLREIDRLKLRENILPEFNGFLNAPEIKKENLLSEEALNRLFNLEERVYSVSQLETYAKCPFKFFVERILKVETVEEPSEDIASVEFGGIVHEILYEFYTEAIDKNIELADCDNEVFDAAVDLLFTIADEKLNSPQFDSPFAFFEKEKLLGIGGNREDSILYRFLSNERKYDGEFKPMLFEAPFGLKDKNGKEIPPVEFNGVKLRGKIDRVEIDEKRKLFNVVDYKIGSAKITKSNLLEGIALQLPVYLFAVQSLLGEDYSPNEMVIYSLRYSRNQFGRKPVGKKISQKDIPGMTDLNEELIRITGEKIRECVNSISRGEFPLSSLENRDTKVCNFCGYSSICRKRETD